MILLVGIMSEGGMGDIGGQRVETLGGGGGIGGENGGNKGIEGHTCRTEPF